MSPSVILLLLYLGATLGADLKLAMPDARPDKDDDYLCTAQKMEGVTKFITSFKPAEKKYAHHMLVFVCEHGPGSNEPYWKCGHGEQPICRPGRSNIIMAWAMDAPGYELPPDTGIPVGPDTPNRYLILQVHYKHFQDFVQNPSLTDRSAMDIGMTYHEPRKLVNLLLLGSNDAVIPGRSKVTLNAGCVKTSPVPLHPISFRVHAHNLSDRIYATVTRNGHQRLVGVNSPKKPQTFYKVPEICPREFLPGDVINAYCEMDNTSNQDVYVGDGAKDEMCNFYIMYWVHARDNDLLDDNDLYCNEIQSEEIVE